MKSLIVASENKTKLLASKIAFESVFPAVEFKILGVFANSNVSVQPISDDETFQGAKNRAQQTKRTYHAADYWIGIESGICDINAMMHSFGWVIVLNRSNYSTARSCTFPLPNDIVEQVRNGIPLGEINLPGGNHSGMVDYLSCGIITRTELYIQPLTLAFSALKKSFYKI